MADSDFSVKAIISAQTSQFEKGIKNAQSSVNSLSSSISNIANLIKKAFAFTGITVGTKAIVDFGKSCVQEANEAIKTFNILDNTVKATGADAWTSIGELESASKSLSDSTNYSVTEIQQMQSVLLGFTNITGEAFDGASEAVLDMATVMGMDLTSAVQTIGKALDDPITGLDSLRRQGFKFTDEQKAELAQLVRNGEQFKAQKIILDTLAISYGGAAKAGQDSFAKQRHSVEDFQEAIGLKLIPVMQVFAENNTQMINSLRKLIENMDFTPVVNVVTNLSKIFAETFKTIPGYLQNVGNYVSDFISRFNFKPIISMLDGLLGGLSEIISKFKEMNSQRLEIFDKLKESLIDFSNSETFQKIVNFVNKIIDAVFFLWSEIQDIGMEIRNLVVNKIIEIWGKIKELFQNGQNALSESGQDIASWGDLFYNILNNAFRSFQDFFGMIKALIHGDWTVAWEYAKLTVMRIADNILDIFSTIANAFPNLINGILKGWNKIIEQINKVREFFGQDPLDLADMFESVDLSKKSGLEDKIKKTENKIQELTGKSADITIQNLESVSTKFAGFTKHSLGEIKKLTEGVETNTDEQRNYFVDNYDEVEDEISENLNNIKKQMLLIKEKIGNVASTVISVIQTIGNAISKAISTFKNLIEIDTDSMLDNLLEIEDKILTFVVETLPKLPSTLSTIITSMMKLFASLDWGSIARGFVSTVKEIITAISDNIDSFSEAIFEIIDGIIEVAMALLEDDEFFGKLFGSITNLLMKIVIRIIQILPRLITNIAKGLIKALTAITTTITEWLPGLIQAIIESVPQFISAAFTIAMEIINALPQIIESICQALPKIIPALVESFIQVFITLITSPMKLIELAAGIVIALVKACASIPSMLIEAVANLVSSFIALFTGDEQWNNSENLFAQIWNGIKTSFMNMINEIKEAWENLINWFKNTGSKLKSAISGAFSGIGDKIKGGWSKVKGGFSTAVDKIKSGWSKLTGGYATGTNNATSGIHLVGEAGPELVRFRGGEQVLNAQNTQKALENIGGSTNNFNIVFNNLQDTSAYTMIQQLRQYNRNLAINGIL